MDYNIAISNLADVFFRIGAYERAVQSYEKCLREYEIDNDSKANDIVNYRKILASYGYCLVMINKLEQAVTVADSLLGMSCDMNCELSTRMSTYTFLSFLYFKKNDRKRAELLLEIATDSALELEQVSSECDVLLNLVNILCQAGRLERLSELLHHMEGKASVEQNGGLLLQILSIHMRYFAEEMENREFRQNAEMNLWWSCVTEAKLM